MEVILLEKVENLGNIGDQVNVKSGFGRNYLIPQGKAVHATEANVAEFEARRAELEAAATSQMESAEARAEAHQQAARLRRNLNVFRPIHQIDQGAVEVQEDGQRLQFIQLGQSHF